MNNNCNYDNLIILGDYKYSEDNNNDNKNIEEEYKNSDNNYAYEEDKNNDNDNVIDDNEI